MDTRINGELLTGKYETYEQAAIEIRDRTRRFGRPSERLTSSRVLLIKGLEYEHAVVAGADSMSPQELYVAITRGALTLSIQAEGTSVSTLPAAPKQSVRKAKKPGPLGQFDLF